MKTLDWQTKHYIEENYSRKLQTISNILNQEGEDMAKYPESEI